MKRFMALALSTMLAISAFATTFASASEVTTVQYVDRYGITLQGESARVENDVIQSVQQTKAALPQNLLIKFQQRAASYTLSPAELIDLAFVGATEAEKNNFFLDLKGEKAMVTYHGNGVITVDEDPAAIEVVMETRAGVTTKTVYSSSKNYMCVKDGIRTQVKQKAVFEYGTNPKGVKYVKAKSAQSTQQLTNPKGHLAKLKDTVSLGGTVLGAGSSWATISTKIYCDSDPVGKVMKNTLKSNPV